MQKDLLDQNYFDFLDNNSEEKHFESCTLDKNADKECCCDIIREIYGD